MKSFEDVFQPVDSAVKTTARELRAIVRDAIPDIEETVVGGSKVQLVLYSSGGSDRLVCGIQPSRDRCLFYLHRVTPEDVPEYKLGGRGKHAKHIAFTQRAEVIDGVIRRLLNLSVERLPQT